MVCFWLTMVLALEQTFLYNRNHDLYNHLLFPTLRVIETRPWCIRAALTRAPSIVFSNKQNLSETASLYYLSLPSMHVTPGYCFTPELHFTDVCVKNGLIDYRCRSDVKAAAVGAANPACSERTSYPNKFYLDPVVCDSSLNFIFRIRYISDRREGMKRIMFCW